MPGSRDIYTTAQGDTWDIIAYRVYGNEYYLDALLAANPAQRAVVRFPAGIAIICPDITIPVSSNLPPWVQ